MTTTTSLTRKSLACAGACGLGILALAGCGSSQTRTNTDVMTAEDQAALSPQQVLTELKTGNKRFATGDITPHGWLEQAEQTAAGQHPKAFVLGCVDSRVPAEVVFDRGIGDVFVGRVAGNVVSDDMLGSMEFATAVAGSKVIVVLGHTECGAVKGAIDGAELGNLTGLLDRIEPAMKNHTHTHGGEHNSKNPAHVNAVIEENVRHSMREIMSRSQVISGLVRDGKVDLVGGVYDIATGKVRWLDS